MSMKCITHQTPLLYRTTGVSRGILIFLISDPKHRLWVLVRNRLAKAVLTCTHNLCFEAKIRKLSKIFFVKCMIIAII